MIQNNSVLAIIPARGGSKGIPRKNIHLLGGLPLIAHTIQEAKKSRYIDRLILSSEDYEIIDVARKFGCEIPFIRPAELAEDSTPGIEPVLHALGALQEQYDYVVLLQPTSPLRIAGDIDGCLELCIAENAPACVSVTEADQHPFWMYRINKDNRMMPYFKPEDVPARRQDLPPVYILNGAIYVAKVDQLYETRSFIGPSTIAYTMPKTRSIDIDEKLDLIICEAVMGQKE